VAAWLSSRSPMATRAPRRTSSAAIAAPIPRAPPVTATVRPASGWAEAEALKAGESTSGSARPTILRDMTSPDTTSNSSDAVLAPATHPGAVHLTVTDLDRSVGFYQDALGLRVHDRDVSTASMGTGGDDLVVLTEEPRARPAGRHAGLYHFALLHPSRPALASALQRLVARRTAIQGASDHSVSEAIYLPDPDGNGIEIYADRPRDVWRTTARGELDLPVAPLDIEDLLSVAPGPTPPVHSDPGLVLGHMHLHVGDVDEAVRFYRDVIGFDVMASLPGASFVSAGGYHHHLGLNNWRGPGVPPAPPGTVGLRHWTLVLDGPEELRAVRARLEAAGVPQEERPDGVAVRDPAGNELLLTTP
jgi:catechol 2,3-dioxygenase